MDRMNDRWRAGLLPLGLLVAALLPAAAHAQERVDLRAVSSQKGACIVSPDASLFAGSNNRELLVWQVVRLRAGDLEPAAKIATKAKPVGFARDGRLLLGRRGTQLDLCDVSRQAVVKTLSLGRGATAVAISPDGKWIATGTGRRGESAVSVWSTRSGKRVRRFEQESERMIVSLAFSPDSKLLAAGGYNEVVRLWEVRGGDLRWECPTPRAILEELAFSPDGETLVAAGTDAFVWDDLTDGEDVQRIEEHNVSFDLAAFLPSEGLVALSAEREIRLWNPASERFVGEVDLGARTGGRGLYALAVTSDESAILVVLRNDLTFWPVPSVKSSGD